MENLKALKFLETMNYSVSADGNTTHSEYKICNRYLQASNDQPVVENIEESHQFPN